MKETLNNALFLALSSFGLLQVLRFACYVNVEAGVAMNWTVSQVGPDLIWINARNKVLSRTQRPSAVHRIVRTDGWEGPGCGAPCLDEARYDFPKTYVSINDLFSASTDVKYTSTLSADCRSTFSVMADNVFTLNVSISVCFSLDTMQVVLLMHQELQQLGHRHLF